MIWDHHGIACVLLLFRHLFKLHLLCSRDYLAYCRRLVLTKTKKLKPNFNNLLLKIKLIACSCTKTTLTTASYARLTIQPIRNGLSVYIHNNNEPAHTHIAI